MKDSNIKLWLAVFLICLLSHPVHSSDEHKTSLIVRTSWHAPYLIYEEKTNKWTGTSIDIVEAVAARAGVGIEYGFFPRKRAFTMIKAGTIDVMLNLTPTEERAEYLDFVGLSSYEQMMLIVKKENKDIKITSLDDFVTKNLTIGVRGLYHYPQLSERMETDKGFLKQVLTIEDATTITLAKQTRQGNYFGYFEDKGTTQYKINNMPEFSGLAIHPFSLNEPQEVHIAVRKTLDVEIRNALREAHKALTEEGVIANIIEDGENL